MKNGSALTAVKVTAGLPLIPTIPARSDAKVTGALVIGAATRVHDKKQGSNNEKGAAFRQPLLVRDEALNQSADDRLMAEALPFLPTSTS
jgi:hypothetical protein